MCGIVGTLTPEASEQGIEHMLRTIAHRGPDEFGLYLDRHIGLGSARLSLMDIANGSQPMRADNGLVAVFNGEIFNHCELRESLRSKGCDFRSRCDTEVILHLYLKHGEAFPKFLNGQFAAAVWSASERKLVLARDRFGICPLFFHHKGGRLLFASEMKAILADPQVPRALNLRAIDQIFTFWTPIGRNTAIDGIEELPPGHTLVCQNETVRIAPYWSWPFPDTPAADPPSFDEAREELVARLTKSVTLRLRADVEVGSYLSGGIDSSAIVAVAAQAKPDALKTYSLGFEERSYDESHYQCLVAEHCGTSHRHVRCSEEDIAGRFERMIWHAETPVFRTAPAPMSFLAEHVRQDGIKAILTGEGADEILLGYDIFREVKLRRFWRRQPDSLWRRHLFRKLYAYLPQFANPRFANVAIESFRGTLSEDSPFYSHLVRWNNNAANKIYYSPELKSALARYDALSELQSLLPEGFERADDIDRAQYLEIVTLLRGYLLSSQGDRAAMANSVETRLPFLDHEFVAFAGKLPRKYKLAGLRDKWILRKAMSGLLPREIPHRPKFAYQAPEIRAFFRTGRRPSPLVEKYLSEETVRETGLFRSDLVSGLLKKARTSDLSRLGARDNGAFVQMLSAHIFHAKFIKSAARLAGAAPRFKTRVNLKAA